MGSAPLGRRGGGEESGRGLAEVCPFYQGGEGSKTIVVPEEAGLLAGAEWANAVCC